MHITLATTEDFDAVLGLIDDAATWLRTKETNQWAAPWPDRVARDARVMRGLAGQKTWIAWDGDTAAATVTLTPRLNPQVWSRPACTCDLSERSVYAHRLITARSHAGLGLGAQLIDWAGLLARYEYGARWIRIDAWSSNTALHHYYERTGFEPCGFCADPDYPSGRLFQKRTSRIEASDTPLLDERPLIRVRPPAPVWALISALRDQRQPAAGFGFPYLRDRVVACPVTQTGQVTAMRRRRRNLPAPYDAVTGLRQQSRQTSHTA